MNLLILTLIPLAFSQESTFDENYNLARQGNDLMWCVTSKEELEKCLALSKATQEAQEYSELAFGSYYRKILCKHFTSKDECMKLIDEGKQTSPNIMSVDAGEVFTGGRYHSLVPIVKEVYDQNQDYYYSLAVVKKDTLPYVQTMRDLRGLKACFPRVGSLAGWTIPVYKLMQSGVMDISDCNNHVKSAIDFFGTSCAVNSLQDRYNPLGDNNNKLCELCGSREPGVRCTNRDPYAEYAGALLCLKEKGDVAFLNEKTIFQNAEDPNDYELLCPSTDGYNTLTRAAITQYRECAWGVAPGNAIVVSSAMDMEERLSLQFYLNNILDRFGSKNLISNAANTASDNSGPRLPNGIQSPAEYDDDSFAAEEEDEMDKEFHLFESAPRYGVMKNLLFDDSTMKLATIRPDDMSYKSFLGEIYGNSDAPPFDYINGVRKCPVGQMVLCVTSEVEMIKCVRMRTALNAQLLEPKMSCKRASTSLECMRLISHNEADVTVLEAGDIYRAGETFFSRQIAIFVLISPNNQRIFTKKISISKSWIFSVKSHYLL